MKIIVEPSTLSGKIDIPASKSVMHRLLLASALSSEETTINNTLCGDDVRATADAICALNLKKMCIDGGKVQLKNIDVCDNIDGFESDDICAKAGLYTKSVPINLNMRESGSSLRFLLPIVCALGNSARISGEGRLSKRPISELLDVLISHGISVKGNGLPLYVSGQLTAGEYVISGNVSSQYITGLLFALPCLVGDSVIIVEGEIVSDGYIKLTLDILAQFGIEITRNGNKFYIKGGQKYMSPHDVTAEGDWSSACFFAVGAALCGDVTILGLDINSEQSDRKIIELLEAFGAKIEITPRIPCCEQHNNQPNDREINIKSARNNQLINSENVNQSARNNQLINSENVNQSAQNCERSAVRVTKNEAKAISFSAKDCPDIVPIMSVALAYADGVSKIYDVDRLRLKESDRLSAIMEMLSELGVRCEYDANCLAIYGKKTAEKMENNHYSDACKTLKSIAIDGKGDHRMVMSSLIAALVAKAEIEIDNCECVAKSYDSFFDDYIKLGGKIRDENAK